MRLFVLTTLFAFLAACAPQVPDSRTTTVSDFEDLPDVRQSREDADQPPKLSDIELCDAREYRPLIGSSSAATTFPVSSSLRVYGENDIVTDDYVPQRTNVVSDASGRIAQVFCG